MHAPEVLAHEPAPAPAPKGAPRPWWEGRPFVAAMIILAMVPLIYPTIPPLVDLPGHMGRFAVAYDLHSSPLLKQWFGYQWKPLGNLGVDVLVNLLSPMAGIELATKLVVMAIPPLTVAGMLWVAREVNNRLPPTVAFALPLAFAHPFLFGFVNFALSMALALISFGLWLRLGRKNDIRRRAALFVPISIVVFFTHAFGWGTLGLLCFSAEAVRQHDRGRSWWRAGLRAAWHASALALPLLAMILWRTEAQGGHTLGWFAWSHKGEYLLRVLRDRWPWWDIASAAVVYLVPLFAVIHPKLTLSRNLAFSALALALFFVLLPRMLFGSAYADMRIVPYFAAILILAVRFRFDTDVRLARTIAIAGVAFLLIRTATMTVSLAMAADHQTEQLAALDHVPEGARVASMVWAPCQGWELRRSDHLPSMLIVRRHGFSNDQWPLVGSSLLTVHYAAAGLFAMDPSQIVRDDRCRNEGRTIAEAFHSLPAAAFDYVWLLDMPPFSAGLSAGWTAAWAGPGSVLLRRDPAQRDAAAAAPRRATRRPAMAPVR